MCMSPSPCPVCDHHRTHSPDHEAKGDDEQDDADHRIEALHAVDGHIQEVQDWKTKQTNCVFFEKKRKEIDGIIFENDEHNNTRNIQYNAIAIFENDF